jgi:hypothetical protein
VCGCVCEKARESEREREKERSSAMSEDRVERHLKFVASVCGLELLVYVALSY